MRLVESVTEQERAAKPLVRREVLRQVLAPSRVLVSRVLLYYVPRYSGFSRPLMSVQNALTGLEGNGTLTVERHADAKWYRLPNVKKEKLERARAEKVPVYEEWNNAHQRAGDHAESLWRSAFRAEGWTVPPHRVRFVCPQPEDPDATHSQEHEVDVHAYRPDTGWAVACEVKNGLGEGWLGPNIVQDRKLNKQERAVRHHFAAMPELGLVPMLAAPLVDGSFYAFQNEYGGVHARYLYHVFDPSDAELAGKVRGQFRLGHVWAEREPPGNFRHFARRLPELLEALSE